MRREPPRTSPLRTQFVRSLPPMAFLSSRPKKGYIGDGNDSGPKLEARASSPVPCLLSDSPVENSCQAPQKARVAISQTKCGKNKVRKRGTITPSELLF